MEASKCEESQRIVLEELEESARGNALIPFDPEKTNASKKKSTCVKPHGELKGSWRIKEKKRTQIGRGLPASYSTFLSRFLLPFLFISELEICFVNVLSAPQLVFLPFSLF